ncbi:MAG: alpha/beta fold hydrolase [Clostridia bacterium]|nr:alpha/beta fold hydrolase [Clostridia bacterium]
MKNELFYLSSDGITNIHAIEWIPDDSSPIAILQICHGMCEYIDRYDDFAQFLSRNGFCVVGNDHLGHGQSVISDDQHGFFSDKSGNECLLEDLQTLRSLTTDKYGDIPYFVLGHSMGSFLIRQYISRYGQGLKGAVIMGTGSQPPVVLGAGMLICKLIALFKGWHYRSKLVNIMALGGYNKRFEPAETKAEWLTKDRQIINKYINDPYSTFVFTVNAYYNMFLSIYRAQSAKTISKIKKDLPLLLISGSDDPVGNFKKGVIAAYNKYKKFDFIDLTLKFFENDRHEVLNELDKADVYEYLLQWFKDRI